MEAFQNIVNKCEFKDMGYSRVDFTWCNQQEGDNSVYLRLDRALATQDWLEHFPNVRVQHLEDTTLNHFPFLLANSNTFQRRGKRSFFFEAIYAKRADCKELIEEVWRASTNLHDPGDFSAGLKKCANSLSKWGKSIFGQILRKITEKQATLSKLTRNDIAGENGAEINRLRKEINTILDDEELWWQQR